MPCFALVLVLLLAAPLCAQHPTQADFDELKRKNAELEKRLEKLEHADEPPETGKEPKHEEEHDEHGKEAHDPRGRDLFRHDFGEAAARVNLHLVGLFAAGYSSVKDRFTEGLQAGNHDPRRRGFNLQQIEVGFEGAIEPYISLEAFAVFTLEGVELEEAFFKTLSLPAGLQLEGGLMFTEFGVHNTLHPHEWLWLDQPVIASRLLGGEGTRGLGLRLGWLTPLPWFSEVHVGVQMADDESMVSFLGEGHVHEGEGSEESPGGFARNERDLESFKELLYLLRWHNRAFAGETQFDIGLSALHGPNATGDKGKTWIFGGDVSLRWRPVREAARPFLHVQGEFMYRYFQADAGVVESVRIDSTVLGDWGGYCQVLVAPLTRWAFGLRAEFADAFREGEERREFDPARDRRFRISPLIEWHPCRFARLRLQYNFDHMQHLRHSTAHGVWLSLEILLGKHEH